MGAFGGVFLGVFAVVDDGPTGVMEGWIDEERKNKKRVETKTNCLAD